MGHVPGPAQEGCCGGLPLILRSRRSVRLRRGHALSGAASWPGEGCAEGSPRVRGPRRTCSRDTVFLLQDREATLIFTGIFTKST